MSLATDNLVKNTKIRLPQTALLLGDASALLASAVIAFALRFEGMGWGRIYSQYVSSHALILPPILAAYLVVFSLFRLYRYAWRFAGLEMVWGVISANTIGLTILATTQLLVEGRTFPRSVLVMIWMLSIFLVGGVRVLLRLMSVSRRARSRPGKAVLSADTEKGSVILGGGTHGARILRAIREDLGPAYRLVGFLDDDPLAKGTYISNVRVLGPLNLLHALLAADAVDEVIVALPETGSRLIRECVLDCRKRKVPVKVIPRMDDVFSGKTYLRLEEFSVEDLLRRPPVETDVPEIGRYLADKRVLVTGAGGSIGSEICRQVLAFGPAAVVMLGHGEHSIFQARQELLRESPGLSDRIHWAIASVAHKARLDRVFSEFNPEVVFHAAAHKHVPIMEANVQEAVYNNVLGTRHVTEICGRRGVKRTVFISTDKAADPTSVMGATKWLCEEIMRASASLWPETAFVSVRFGNVLGSRGSVVPLFREQIKHGGPVTVTHPEMTRYFMTIPEAVQLVLQAGIIGRSGQLYLLDMGEPVRILDLARDMIRLSGFEPEVDIPIAFTGIRPGERLCERLIGDNESMESASGRGMALVRRPERFSPSEFLEILRRVEEAAEAATASELRGLLYSIADERPASTEDLESALSPQSYRALAQS